MKSKVITFILLFCLTSATLYGQKSPNFQPGERLEYEVYFNLGFLRFNIAKAIMQVDEVLYKSKPAYKLQIYANTHKGYGENTLNDTLTAYLDKTTLKPLNMVQVSRENKYYGVNHYNYNYNEDMYNCHIKRIRAKGIEEMQVSDSIPFFDVVTYVYMLRDDINPNKLHINQKVNNRLVLDDGIYPLYWRYAGQERVKLRGNKQVYDCLKVKPAFVDSSLFDDGEVMTLYVSDDENRIPIMIDAKLKIGSISAYLSNYKNLKHPLKSLVQK